VYKEKSEKFYIGSEAEHTPAFSKKTLFVVSFESIEEVLQHATTNNVKHVVIRATSKEDINKSTELIGQLLTFGFIVTLDYNVIFHSFVNETLSDFVWTNRNFIPLVRNDIEQLDRNPNLTLKVENATNFGVWFCSVEKLKDNNSLTQWTDYSSYTVIDIPEQIEQEQTEQKAEAVQEVVQEKTLDVEKNEINNSEAVVQDILASHTQEGTPQQSTKNIKHNKKLKKKIKKTRINKC